MTDDLLDPSSSRPQLPQPQRERWQPLRLGLVELFHYDSEEFWFHDGHLLLRGNNGTGKSKVLSLTLPLLFDASMRPSRIEPDGDSGKKMAWNLLLGSYPRRVGYSWIEFGRRERDGRARYLTLGVGLSAVAGRAQVDSWYFLLEGDGAGSDPRIGQDLWLATAQRQVLTRERLKEALVGRGQLFESAQAYRNAVDERLFKLGTRRYDALMDTLIQLRQPQLSKKPDEAGLSNALGESLPPLSNELLGDVAEALNQLEEDRTRLDETRRLEQAVVQFERRYRVYAGMLARRQARELRQAQTGFDNASEARNQAVAALQQAHDAERDAGHAHEAARQAQAVARERVETLQSDPANQDANRLGQADKDAQQRRKDADAAAGRREEAGQRVQREAELGRQRCGQAEGARAELEASRAATREAAAGIAVEVEVLANPLLALASEDLAERAPEPRQAGDALRAVATRRKRDIVHLRQRHAAVGQCQMRLSAAQEAVQASRDELDAALARREQADQAAEAAGEALVEAWSAHCAGLVQLRLDAEAPLQRLAEWVPRPEGENPAQAALAGAWQAALQQHAARDAQLVAGDEVLRQQRAALEDERARLAAGEDAAPPLPATRGIDVRSQRAGAPLWQLVDFHPSLDAGARAGLEAALEASGLLDAWVSPDGSLSDRDGQALLDAGWYQRAPVSGTHLGEALEVTLPQDCAVDAATVAALLAGVAYGPQPDTASEAWLAPDGRYRLGTLAGAWHKPQACYVGHSARAQARQRRLEEIGVALAELEDAQAQLERERDALQGERAQVEREWTGAPPERPLRDAIAAATLAGEDAGRARQRLERDEIRRNDSETAVQAAREQLRDDAADLGLSSEPEALPVLEQALEHFEHAQVGLVQAVREWQRAWPEHLAQRQREDEARQLLDRAEEGLAIAEELSGQARMRLETLQEAVGQRVEELQRRLAAACDARNAAERQVDACHATLVAAGKTHAVAASRAGQAEALLAERIAERLHAVDRLQHFVGSGLLASALPELELPAQWSVDPALTLARRIEQGLLQVADDDTAWTRVQKQVSEDLMELQRGLGVLGHQAVSEPNDWGFTVAIQYQNRAERPDTLARLLAEDIAQRSELLSAREREVLENHLQAEIAAEIQRLMRGASERVAAINAELHKRPTSTGVRYRLRWEPLSVEEGAPAGLEQARERLLNTSADLWSAEDRSAVGRMLQQQIAAERSRADAEVSGGSLVDQLARALDYRHWHRFRIERQQDGQWRKLSGPASSGERALGLTVPLFAAIASFYDEHGGNRLAPRLMLLDEAFAGIDDAARAHCMGLVREFDLDFVLTSEREWACYAELPGVAICQLQRREGIDAVFVSRWTWDGSARRREDDPDRRFPPA